MPTTWSIPVKLVLSVCLGRLEAGQEGALVAVALDEGVDRLAVGRDRRHPHGAVLVADRVGLEQAAGAAANRDAIGLLGVGDRQRHDLDTVAVVGDVARDLEPP